MMFAKFAAITLTTCAFIVTTTMTATAAPPNDDAVLHMDRDLATQIVQSLPHAGFVGATAAFTRPGEPLWAVAAGKTARAQDGGAPLSPAHRMRIGSITKPIVATAVMRLVERGTWALDDTANSIKPGILPGHDDVTLRHLLSHTSGIMDGTTVQQLTYYDAHPGLSLDDKAAFHAQPHTEQESIDAALSVPGYPTGSVSRYSNTNYIALGMLLEHVTQRSLREVLLQEVFGPAGMTTATYVDVAHPQHDTSQYLVVSTQTDTCADFSAIHPGMFGAAGNVDATPTDMVRFWQSLAQGVLVSPATYDLMRKPSPPSLLPMPDPKTLPRWDRPNPHYGLGITTIPMPPTVTCERADGSKVTELVGHGGNTVGTGSSSFLTPDGATVASSSTNTVSTGLDYVKPTEANKPWISGVGNLDIALLGWFCDKLTLHTRPTAPLDALRQGVTLP